MVSNQKTPVTAIHHTEKRANIPTEELRDFIADEEREPKPMLYPRDPSLDPQLVWNGKDEQDQHPLEVPAVPIYIQESISPQAIIENVRTSPQPSPEGEGEVGQLALFADFNHIEFADRVDFYHHEQNWTNRMILGDSLLVMTSLAEKEALKGKVQMIYLDPPYGIKFGSNWQVSTRKRDVKDGKEDDATRQPEQIKAFRDTWELGIHSYLAYLRDRLTVARDLLTESGSVFVQIGNENLHLVRCIMDEVFGSENFCSLIAFRKTTTQSGDLLADTNDYILWYAKDRTLVKYRYIYQSREGSDWVNYDFVKIEDSLFRRMSSEEKEKPAILPKESTIYRRSPLTSASKSDTTSMRVSYQQKNYLPGSGGWKTNILGFSRLEKSTRLEAYGATLAYRRYVTDFPYFLISNNWTDTASGGYGEDKIYVVQTNVKVITRCMLMTTDPGDLVLDPTCGSGTTAYVAEQWGRRWITIDTSRVAMALARTRLMAARYPYYLLADSPEGTQKERELNPQAAFAPPAEEGATANLSRGFVYKRVPHITLKSIANNEEIDGIYAKWQAELEPLRTEINRTMGQHWEEWEMPREVALTPTLSQGEREKTETMLAEWWELRRKRQAEIDASIARRADIEYLFDQPYEDNKRVRVSGPFTVESLSPHRVLSTDVERPASEVEAQRDSSATSFENMILSNLRTAGVQNTRKGERLKFTHLDPFAGVWLQATGEYEEKATLPQPSPKGEGVIRRVAICIGPEHGTVGPELVKDAAKEAVQGLGFDLLVVLGYAFDPHVSEEVKHYGKLTILPGRINPDLQMGPSMLKKTSAANLFTVFGEPDVEVKPAGKDGKLQVSIHGVDIYDPTTGEIRSSSTDEIACWFIDTDYNGESFYVRHAYFTGADEPYDKLKRALRADIDEAAWSALYSTTSFPFEKPAKGKIAVKVINHYGDEVLKVYNV